MNTIVISPERRLTIFQAELVAAKNTGNYGLTTSAGLCIAVHSFDVETVYTYLLKEMGISANIVSVPDGLLMSIVTPQSFATVTRALRGSFAMQAAITEDGRQAIKVLRT